ncbi:Ism1p [Malassezia vespertilionis]|uniref:isoleucine--tRNA ligase n=1 Tax=Malassezia vespertilionis TaxID=2020962 RepID=A0A2N1JG93_9BASI|nr:Ism1p [Malassezia vespertilionis]
MVHRMQMVAYIWILKDFILRFQVLQRRRVHYMPGWDCHGLPIEVKAVAEEAARGATHLSPTEIRHAARNVALRELVKQREAFKDFSIMADWSEECAYRTMHFPYEITQLELFSRMVERGLIYQQFRPVYWSPSSGTALAEAEIEYDDQHRSRSAYVAFTLLPNGPLRAKLAKAALHTEDIKLVVWTTTPWTLLGNMALAVSQDAQYSIVRTVQGAYMLVASELVDSLQHIPVGLAQPGITQATLGDVDEVLQVSGYDLVGARYHFPFMEQDTTRKIISAPFVTTTSGTGIVHMAPAHGQEDYQVWRDTGNLAQHGLVSHVDGQGRFAFPGAEAGSTAAVCAAAQALDGQEAMYEGNQSVLALLYDHGALLGERLYTHSYPIDWRTKKPLMMRATSQWFADLSHISGEAQAALEHVHFVPATGRNRLASLVARRSEWCISRQRPWGVPLPAVYNAATGEALLTKTNIEHILGVFAQHKSMDCWWTLDAETFVASEYRDLNAKWIIKGDTLDVWFDSGSSWAVLQSSMGRAYCTPELCADVYLEGTDQHRGWFQSSLLTRISTCGDAKAPYANLVTHGFVVDDAGRKMSKSVGNVIAPESFIFGDEKNAAFPPLGTDILRWWAAKADYTRDMPISPLIMKHAADEVRKLRNTARFLLANVGNTQTALPEPTTLRLLDRYIMHELLQLDTVCHKAYQEFDFPRVVRRLNEFVTCSLSSLYLDVVKDILYAGGGSSRENVVAILDQILYTMTCILAPILPHLAEDIHWYRSGAERDPTEAQALHMPSFFQQGWTPISAAWEDFALASTMQQILNLRSDVFGLMTRCKEASLLKSMPQAALELYVPDAPLYKVLFTYQDQLCDLFSAAQVALYDDYEAGVQQ